jgi:serine/threonine kinase PknH
VACQRGLSVANNVAVDLVVCSFSESDPSINQAVNLVHQIAAKVSGTQ